MASKQKIKVSNVFVSLSSFKIKQKNSSTDALHVQRERMDKRDSDGVDLRSWDEKKYSVCTKVHFLPNILTGGKVKIQKPWLAVRR